RTWGPAHVHRRGPVLRDGDLRALDKPVQGLQNYRSSHAAPPEAPKRASGWPVPAAPRRACGHSTGARRLQTTVHPRSRLAALGAALACGDSRPSTHPPWLASPRGPQVVRPPPLFLSRTVCGSAA
ncbi:hypothetical protein IscW_ISCW013048, partial [Ixodes scapularis]